MENLIVLMLGPIKNKDGDHVILNIHREAQGNNALSQINNGENISGCNIVRYLTTKSSLS
jgi:hypothetical protein